MLIAYPWKWISSRAQPARDPYPLGGLYDLERDPFESDEAGAEHPEIVATLRGRLEERARRNAPKSAALHADDAPRQDGAMPREVRDALEVLGYLEAEDPGPVGPVGDQRGLGSPPDSSPLM